MLVHRESRDDLAAACREQAGLAGIEKEPLPAQFCLHKALKLPGVKAAGEGEIVTVAGVGDVPLGTPAANRPVALYVKTGKSV